MTKTNQSKNRKIAFALSGLAGNNAHGAGFLQASLESGVRPDLISCTSGQIYWVYLYLKALRYNGDDVTPEMAPNLRRVLLEEIEARPTGTLGAIQQIMLDRPGKMLPDFSHFYSEFALNSWNLLFRSLRPPREVDLLSGFLHLFPSQWLKPDFPDEFYQEISHCFNQENDIGIFLNSYNPTCGHETVYANAAAKRTIWFKNRTKQDSGRIVYYEDITPKAVKDALRLCDDGFDRNTNQNVDGEYFRPVILRELLKADDIYVVKPGNTRWLGDLPASRVELGDLRTEISINAIYSAERSNIEFVNTLISKGTLDSNSPFHKVNIMEVEPLSNEGFDDSTMNDAKIFDEARTMGMTLLTENRT